MMKPHYVIVDVETTGLDRARAQVIEIAAIVLDSESLRRVGHHRIAIAPIDTGHLEQDAYEMHLRSGLWQEAVTNGVSLDAAQHAMLSFLASCGVDVEAHRSAIIVGNNPSFDRAFLDRCFPVLARCLHYRMIDVSSLRQIAALCLGTSADLLKRKLATHAAHTALNDCENCLVEFFLYSRALASSTLRLEIERFAAEHVERV